MPTQSDPASASGSAPEGAVEEPDALCCPITHCMLRDPVFVPESGTTYEREALLNFWRTCAGRRRDVLSNQPLSSEPVSKARSLASRSLALRGLLRAPEHA